MIIMITNRSVKFQENLALLEKSASLPNARHKNRRVSMAHRIVSDEVLHAAALTLFRTYGFEGVSLKRLANATGLEKASLYYRYPGGKDEIAMAVVKEVISWFQENVFAPLAGSEPTYKRVSFVADQLRQFYSGGSKACLMDVLSIPGASDDLQLALKGAMQAWIDAFAQVAEESGLEAGVARSRAEEAIIHIEGSLILARVLGDTTRFEHVLKLLPHHLTKA